MNDIAHTLYFRGSDKMYKGIFEIKKRMDNEKYCLLSENSYAKCNS